jgi:hypothetical protein
VVLVAADCGGGKGRILSVEEVGNQENFMALLSIE